MFMNFFLATKGCNLRYSLCFSLFSIQIIIVLFYYHFVLLSFCFIIILFYYHFVLLSFCFIIILFYYHFVLVSFCFIVILFYYHFVLLSFCFIIANIGGGPTTFLYMATRFLPNVHVQKCTKMYKICFFLFGSSLDRFTCCG